MNPQQYEQFTQALQERLAADDRVIGLIALGSMAEPARRDQWSDHDFWVITQTGSQELFLADLTWLPQANEIILAFRQAVSYYTILYRSGHSAEFAVFDRERMQQGKLNCYAVLLDKENIAPSILQIQEQTITSTRAQQAGTSDTDILNYFFLQLLTGVQRYLRGERLSSQQNIDAALDNLLFLIQRHIPAQDATMLDCFDRRRHFERTYPSLASQIQFALGQGTPATALGLLHIADSRLAAPITDYPHEVANLVREKIENCRSEL